MGCLYPRWAGDLEMMTRNQEIGWVGDKAGDIPRGSPYSIPSQPAGFWGNNRVPSIHSGANTVNKVTGAGK